MFPKVPIQSLRRADLEDLVRKLGGSPTHSDAIFKRVYRQSMRSWKEMTGIRDSLMKGIESTLDWGTLHSNVTPSSDGSARFIFGDESQKFEAVYIPHEDRVTVCISSQIGCALDCAFCVTGLLPFRRNLETWEMVEQVLCVQRHFPTRKITNLVFMGMGEPLLNYEACKRTVEILSDDLGLAIARSKITLSTAGILSHILLWGREVRTNLAVSITGSSNMERSQWMSINDKYPLDALVETLHQYSMETRRRVFCEYVLIAGATDRDEDVQNLIRWFSDMNVTLNLIPYNENDRLPYRRPSNQRIEELRTLLTRGNVFTTVRWSSGADVQAACGQLAGAA